MNHLLEPPRFNPAPQRKPGFRLAFAAVLFAVSVIALGAFTRLVDAGLGCPDWPGCYGHLLWPKTDAQVEQANLAFPEMPVEHDKTWPEMVHRYLATGLGVFVIAIVALAFRHRGEGQPLRLPLALLGLVIVQGLFGMWTVTLKLWPQVVTAHLLGGFATLSLLWLLTLRLDGSHWHLPGTSLSALRGVRTWVLAGLVAVILQIALGGWTTSNYAAVACHELPTCEGRWWPEMDFAHGFNIFQQVGPNYLGGMMHSEARVAIHMMHRLGAIVVTVVLLLLCWQLWRLAFARARRMALIIGLALAVQLLLGLSNIWFAFPVSVAVAHNLGGALLLLTLVTLTHRTLTARSASLPQEVQSRP